MRAIFAGVIIAAIPAFGATIVVPPANSGVEGTGVADLGVFVFGGSAFTSQIFIPQSMLSGIPNGNQITGMGFRLDSTASTGPSSTLNWTNFDVTLSVPSATYSSNLGTLFASNIGGDAVLVRSGALSITGGSYPGGSSPNAFGTLLAFTSPYTYTGGALLITIRQTGSGGADLLLDVDANFIGTELYGGDGYTSTVGNSSIARIPITELQYGPAAVGVPEPGTLGLMAAGFAALIAIRRRRRV